MADAEFTFKATGAETVVAANKRIEQSMQQQAKASSKSGYAILEASRALEDFTMAGMRGALNNLPQLMMHLGIGAGLTGVIAAASVVLWKGGQYLNAYAEGLSKLNINASKINIPVTNVKTIERAFSREAVENAKAISEVIDGINKQSKMREHSIGLGVNEAEAEASLRMTRLMLAMTRAGVSDDAKGVGVMNEKIKQQNELLEPLRETLKLRQAEHDEILATKKDLEETVNASKAGENISINKDFFRDFRQFETALLSESRKRLVEQGFLEPELFGDGSFSNQDKLTLNEKAVDLAIAEREQLLASKGLTDEEIKLSIQGAMVAKEKLSTLEKELQIKADSLDMADKELKSARKVSELKSKDIEEREILARLERKQKQEEEDKKKAEAEAKKNALLAEKSIDASSFLSSQGRVGMAGNEAKSAMDALSVSKQQLKALHEIARNTKYGRKTAYN